MLLRFAFYKDNRKAVTQYEVRDYSTEFEILVRFQFALELRTRSLPLGVFLQITLGIQLAGIWRREAGQFAHFCRIVFLLSCWV